MPHVCCVGIACLDIVNVVACYPAEDAAVRTCDEQRVRCGGNATNTLTVLAGLGAAASWLGSVGAGPNAHRCLADLAAAGVSTAFAVPKTPPACGSGSGSGVPAADGAEQRHALALDVADQPTSYITLSQASGSRTIVHHNRLAELEPADFERRLLARGAGGGGGGSDEGLDGVDWLHFEGRNCAAYGEMMRAARRHSEGSGRRRAPLVISLELEKFQRPGLEQLAPLADVLFVGRAWAEPSGFACAEDALLALAAAAVAPPQELGGRSAVLPPLREGVVLVCAWGEAGACALDTGARPLAVLSSPAFPPPGGAVVDSVGAGDTFIAGMVWGMATGLPLAQTLREACALAGRKVGVHGLDLF